MTLRRRMLSSLGLGEARDDGAAFDDLGATIPGLYLLQPDRDLQGMARPGQPRCPDVLPGARRLRRASGLGRGCDRTVQARGQRLVPDLRVAFGRRLEVVPL